MTHHAILIRTNNPSTEIVETEELELVVDQTFEKLTIDDVRFLKESVYRLPEEGYVRNCFVIRTPFVTVEAQHALLKILEEPPTVSRFVFVTVPALELLTTVQSRFHHQPIKIDITSTESFDDFLSSPLKNRLEMIEVKMKGKDLAWQEDMRQGVISYLRTNNALDKNTLVDIQFVASNLLKRGSSNKMLLDQLALSLPLN